MVSEEAHVDSLSYRVFLESFSLSETKGSVEQKPNYTCAHHDSLLHQRVAAEDAPELAVVWTLSKTA